MASIAPFITIWSPYRIPLIRVSAVNGISSAPSISEASTKQPRCSANATMLRPSGVSSARLDRSAASMTSCSVCIPTGVNENASRLPKVIVPVLSKRRVSTSPAASTARPLRARTLNWTSRSIPAMPIGDNRPPIVVGIRQTSSATRVVTSTLLPE